MQNVDMVRIAHAETIRVGCPEAVRRFPEADSVDAIRQEIDFRRGGIADLESWIRSAETTLAGASLRPDERESLQDSVRSWQASVTELRSEIDALTARADQ